MIILSLLVATGPCPRDANDIIDAFHNFKVRGNSYMDPGKGIHSFIGDPDLLPTFLYNCFHPLWWEKAGNVYTKAVAEEKCVIMKAHQSLIEMFRAILLQAYQQRKGNYPIPWHQELVNAMSDFFNEGPACFQYGEGHQYKDFEAYTRSQWERTN